LIPFPNTGLKISPSALSLDAVFEIVNSSIVSPFLTSSQCSGVETGAAGLGLNEYGAAIVCMLRFWR